MKKINPLSHARIYVFLNIPTYYFPTSGCCPHCEDQLYNPSLQKVKALLKTRQIKDLPVMARLKLFAFGLSLASSSSGLMNPRMKSLESSVTESIASLSYSHFYPFQCCQRLPCCYFVAMSWHFSVLVDQLLEHSSVASSVLQLPLVYFLPLLYSVRDSLRRPLKLEWGF